jgi:DNA primase
VSQLKNLKEIIFFLNGDEAGREWTKKHTETVSQLMPPLKIGTVNTPNDEDTISLVQGHEAEILPQLQFGRYFI